MMRSRLGFAAALMAMLGLAASALAAQANTKSTSYAGYIDTTSTGHWTISARIVVPKVTCTAGEYREITPTVGVEAASSPTHVGLIVGCANGKVTYRPVLELSGITSYPTTNAILPGDTIQLKVSLSTSDFESVVDKTHMFKAIRKTPQGSMGFNPYVGDLGRNLNGVPMGVPSFGAVHFSAVLVNGLPLGSSSSLRGYNRVTLTGTLQIQTSALASNDEAFTTTFKHA
jgi:hypothetical protein